MGRGRRIEEVICAICYDSLFTKKDDLNDSVPIATSECGHVFHEPCLLKWFSTQSAQFLAAARDQGLDGRYGSPSLSEAPVECPSCRAECFANPETGEPSIHRLYIDFGGLNDGDSSLVSSSPPSSPSPRRSRKGKEKENEVLGLARRAKGITAEARGLDADSMDEEVEGMLRRGEGLAQDLVETKVLNTVKGYMVGLQDELKNLRNTLETNPLIPVLREQIVDKEREMVRLTTQTRSSMERGIQKVKDEERIRCDTKIKKAEEDRDLIKREYEKEKVQRKTGIRAMEEREKEYKRQLEEVTEQLKKEKESRELLQNTVKDRTKQLKVLQKKVEDRKDMKLKIAALQAENARLAASRLRAGSFSHSPDSEADSDDGDTSILEISGSRFPSSARSFKVKVKHPREEDESLQIDMPSFHDHSLQSPSRLLPSKTTMKHLESSGLDISPNKNAKVTQPRMHPTARTITFDMDAEKKKDRRRSTSSKFFPTAENDNKENGIARSGEASSSRGKILVSASPESVVRKSRDGPSPPKRSKTNPFMTNKSSVEKRKELPSLTRLSNVIPNLSSSSISSSTSGKHVNRNREHHDDNSVINLADSSPESSPKRPIVTKKKVPNAAMMLGLADERGRPKGTLAIGQKVRRM